ncbi:MAG: helix-turn-helix domain-containing protein [Bdellovibrionota bacterium]
MKTRRSVLRSQRQALDRKLKPGGVSAWVIPPRGGWIKAAREALMMNSRQLAARMGISQATLSQMQKREPKGAVTVATLNRAAEALGVQLAYGFVVPEGGSFEGLMRVQARRVASRFAGATRQTMRLESQEVDDEITRAQRDRLVEKLIENGGGELWGTDSATTKSSARRRLTGTKRKG